MEKSKNGQKIIIIIVLIILIIISFVAVYLSRNIDDNNNSFDFNKEITRLNNFDEYYAVQNAINKLYSLEMQEDSKEIMKLFLKSYIEDNNITSENVLDFLHADTNNTIYYAEEIYYNDNSSVTYYFIKGYTISYPLIDGDLEYNPDICYLLIVDNNSNYTITPLPTISNLEVYAKNFAIKEISNNNNVRFSIKNVTDENRLKDYISNFSNLMFLDENKAYSMLDINTKNKYPDINTFINEKSNIYERLFTYFWDSETVKNIDNTIYTVKNYNEDTITITEYNPYDYKIGFEFVEIIE